MHLVEAGVDVDRKNQLLLEVRSEDGLLKPLRSPMVMSLARSRGAVI